MKTMMKAILAAMFVAMLVIGMAGCDGGNGNETDPKDKETKPQDNKPETPEEMFSKTALQYLSGLKMGINLGNTLDAVDVPSAATETAWGNPKATQAVFNGIKESGFDIVRIPTTWFGHIGSPPDYKVSEARLARVAEVVGYAKTAGLKAIINIHHDGNNARGDQITWGFVDMPGSVSNATKKDAVQDEIGKVWTQIAEYFKDYGDYLIFETLNEVHNGNWGGGASAAEQTILFDWNQAALSAIRATGGNNAKRYVAVPGLGATEPYVVVAAHNAGKLLPNDPGNGTSRLIVAVHYYDPAQYTVASQTDQAFQLVHTWGTTAEKNELTQNFQSLKSTFFDKGIAVYAGEWGAPTNVRATMSDTIKNTHKDYITSVAKAARENGVLPIYWDDGGDFKILERSNGKPKSGLWADTLAAIKSGINGATPPVGEEPPSGEVVKTVIIGPNVYDAGDGEKPHGYQLKIAMSELLSGGVPITTGDNFTFTYTFTSNVAIGNLQVVLSDTRPEAGDGYWNELSAYVDIGAVTVGTSVSGSKTITATGTAGDSTNAANQFVFNIGEGDSTASTPTLTFTQFTLTK